MEIKNGCLKLEFDDHSGSLISLQDIRTGEEHLSDNSQASLFRLIIPAETWQSRFVEANQQDCILPRDVAVWEIK